jgi:hypothetical protein
MCNCNAEGYAGGNCEDHGPWRNDEYAQFNGRDKE